MNDDEMHKAAELCFGPFAGKPTPELLDQREFRHRAFRAWLDHNLTAWRSGGNRPSRAAI